MKILWIIDNKFRELYGLHDLKRNLLKYNIILYAYCTDLKKKKISNFINVNIFNDFSKFVLNNYTTTPRICHEAISP